MKIHNTLTGTSPKGFYKISDTVYFAQPQISNSDLSNLKVSPKKFNYAKTFGGFEKTPSMALGSLVHCMFLEPELVTQNYIVEEKHDKRTKAGKEGYAQFLEKANGKEIVSEEVWDKANAVVASLNDLGTIADIAGPGHAELAAFFELNGVACRAKMDYLTEDGSTIYDLKTTRSLIDFEKSVANYGYHRQAAFYGKGLSALTGKFKGFYFVVVETEPPYDCAILTLDLDSIKRGLSEVTSLLETYQSCASQNVWPGCYPTLEPTVIKLPRWY